jgi:hypothetical protein
VKAWLSYGYFAYNPQLSGNDAGQLLGFGAFSVDLRNLTKKLYFLGISLL